MIWLSRRRAANVRTVTSMYRNLATMQLDVVASFCSELMTVTVHSAHCATDFLAGRYIGKQVHHWISLVRDW